MPAAIVTGSSTGIGRSIAVHLSRTRSIVVNAKKDADGAEQTCFEINQAGGRARYIVADVSTDAGVAEIVEFARATFGPPDTLVNNAGVTKASSFGDWDAFHWGDMLSNNLTSCALMSQAFVASLETQRGSIVNVASVRGTAGNSRIGVAAYSAAKAGVISLTSALARSLAPHITVNCVSPGFVATEYMGRADPMLTENWLRSVPIARLVQPSEIAEAVGWLIDQRAITGSNIVIDGGWTVTAV